MRIDGHGYSVLPPEGEGWTLVRRTAETVVFGKHRPQARARRGDGPYLLLAGVQVVPAEAGEDFSSGAQRWLSRRLQVPGRQLLTLEVRAAPWQGQVCVQYEALQVDRYDFDEPNARFEYAHLGRLCRHPNASTLWILAYRSARSLRLEGPPAGWEEAQEFIHHVLLMGPSGGQRD